jgi:hypothetical protein
MLTLKIEYVTSISSSDWPPQLVQVVEEFAQTADERPRLKPARKALEWLKTQPVPERIVEPVINNGSAAIQLRYVWPDAEADAEVFDMLNMVAFETSAITPTDLVRCSFHLDATIPTTAVAA